MEEVIDCINAATSPEELAIHFLMRHSTCRMALIELTEESQPQRPLDGSQLNIAVTGSSSVPGENTATRAKLASALAEDDSCAAHFSRAYAAARHMSAPRHTMTAAGSAAA